MNCIFCDLVNAKPIYETDNFFCLWDIDPIQEGHILIISKRHFMNISELPSILLDEMINLQKYLISVLEEHTEVLGVTTIYNNGKTMMNKTHFHFHVIPRYKEDGFYESLQVERTSINKSDLLKVFES